MPRNNCKGTRNDDFVECARCFVHLTRKQIHYHYTTFKYAKNGHPSHPSPTKLYNELQDENSKALKSKTFRVLCTLGC